MKKILMTLLVSGVLVGAVYGVANSLTLGGVDDLGAAVTSVDDPSAASVSVTDISWSIDDTDATLVEGFSITLTEDGTKEETCTVAVNVMDGVTLTLSLQDDVVVATSSSADAQYGADAGGGDLDLVALDIDGVEVTLACEN